MYLKNCRVLSCLLAKVPAALLFILLIFCCNNSKSQSRLYLSNDDHTDYMWSADEATYDTLFTNMIDAWIANNNATNTSPADYQTKFNLDGTYWAWAYQKKKTAAQFQTFINQIKSERLVMPMNPLIITYGCVPAEATLRGMYYAGELQRNYNIPFEMAMSMEDQVVPLGLPSLWKGSGAKYTWHGICNCFTQVPNLTNNRQEELYRYKGLDDSSVLMKWYSINNNASYEVGGYAEAKIPDHAVTDLTNKVNTSNYNYNVAGAFGVGWDDLETLTDNLAPEAMSASNSSRRVIVSNELDFFRDIETNYGSTLPSLTQSYGNEWETACASMAEVSASVKRSLEKLRAAEAMATIVGRTNPSFATSLDSIRRQAWMSLGLYWEHDFVGGSPAVTNTERAAWQVRMQQNFSGYVDQLYSLAEANLAIQINKPSTTSNRRFFVFNPLSWQRTDYADFPYSGTSSIYVVDVSTNAQVRSQIILKNDTQYVRVLASNVPSEGYKIFEIRSGSGSISFANAATVNSTTQTIDNDFYTIVFNKSGTITSLIDKANGNKQLVNSASKQDLINNLSRNQDYVGTDNSGSFTIVNSGPVSVTVNITSSDIINHTTSLTVFNTIPRIEIDNQITENFGNDSVYNTFSFNTSNISSPTIWHEENGAVINAKTIANGGHYANDQARYDLLTLNHFAAISNNGNYGVTVSNQDCYFMQTGNSTTTSLDGNTAKIKVLVGGKIDDLGMDSQNNNDVFNQRYAISTYNTYSAANSMKSSLEHQNAFVAAEITNTSGFLPVNNFSFLNISDTNTLVWALKPIEEGMDIRGALVRVWNFANTNTSANTAFTFNDNLTEAENVSHIETDISPASFNAKVLTTSIGKNQIKSYRIKLTPSAALLIRLTEFTGVKQNAVNKLSWKADSGIDFSHFEVERSEDGNSFDSLTSINENSLKTYGYDDANIDELKSYYYRLKLVQNDESFTYSSIVLIMTEEHVKDILIYPNPVKNLLQFQLVLTQRSRYDVSITDIAGKTIMKLPQPLFEAGNNYFSINTSNLTIGTYTLIVRNSDNKYIRKFIKH